MITEKKLLKISSKYTLIGLAISLFFWLVVFDLGICHAQTQTGFRVPARLDIGGGRMTGDMWCQYGTNGVRFKIGTQAVTQVGTVGVINGTNATSLPSLDFTYGGGSMSANFNGFNAVYVAGSQVGTSGALTGKLDAVGGVGTNNTFNNPTLAGVGTITASFGANGLVITPAEYSATNNATGELQSQIDGKQPTLINNSPGTVTNVLGYTPPANTQGSVTTALGYTPLANASGSITAVLGYTPPANTSGSITTALGYTPTNLGNTIELGTETTGSTSNISEGSNLYHTEARVNTVIGSATLSDLSDVGTATEGQFLKFVGGIWSGAASSVLTYWSDILGSPVNGTTANSNFVATLPEANKILVGLPELLRLQATTTTSIETEATGRFRLVRNSQFSSTNTNAMLLHFDGTGSSTTFTDSSNAARTVTATGGAVISTAYSVFGGASLRPAAATGSYASIADDDDFDFGTSNFTIGGRVFFNTISTAADLIKKGEDSPNKSFTVEVDSAKIHLLLSTSGTGNQYDFPGTHTFALGTWTAWEICRNGSDIHFFINGNQLGAKQFIGTSTSIYNSNQAVWVGGCQAGGNWLMDGYQDEVYTIKGTALHTGTYTVSVSPYVAADLDTPSSEYYSYSMQYIPAYGTQSMITYHSPGTGTNPSYVFSNVTTTAFGYGSTTSMSSVGSSNAYSTESLAAELATNFVVKSKDTKGRNFEEVTVNALDKINNAKIMSWNPANHKDMNRLDAEAMAKEAFVRQKKEDWKSLHEMEYISKTIETGTGTINVIDSVKLDKAYKDYIELEWASSPEQTDWINTVEDNAESDLTMRNYGLRLGDPTTPDEIRKPGGVGLMDSVALSFKAIQELKAIVGSLTAEVEALKNK